MDDVDLKETLAEIRDWQHQHGLEDAVAFKDRPTKEEMKQIVHDALVEFFSSYGRIGYKTIITVASLVIAMGIITGGFTKVLTFFGLALTKQ